MAKEPAPTEREKRIKFKENLIDFEAPPNDDDIGGTPRSPRSLETTSESTASQKSDSLTAGKKLGGSLLIEKEGKFELVNESDVQDDGESKNSSADENKELDIEDLLKLNSAKPDSQKPSEEKETPVQEVPSEKKPPSRPGSAPSKSRNAGSAQTHRNLTSPRPRSAASTDKLFRLVVIGYTNSYYMNSDKLKASS